MIQDYWQRQGDSPLFPDLLWSRPEMKSSAGKLLIVGGNAQSFAVPAEAYTAAEKAGIGTVRVMLPDVLERTVSRLFPGAEFAPSNPSGGFATNALAELLAAAQWADGVLLAGDMGRNSESLAMLENFASKYAGQLTITKDTADFFCTQPTSLQERPSTLLIINTSQLQRLATSLRTKQAFTSDMGMLQFVDLLHDFTKHYTGMHIITHHQNHFVVAANGQVSTTADKSDENIWQVATGAVAAVWWLQNPSKAFEALTTSLVSDNSI